MVVIAEGAEDGMIPEEHEAMREKLGMKKDEVKKDESGNVKSIVSKTEWSYLIMAVTTSITIDV